ncbi:MAG TPA: transcriptional regulator [Candidatus Latescibacteria bacterium]|nr:transcriptional regulator [Gemmatimonadota bacterium]HCR16629.1 transcriptional regulator [Candidatus Latescibacterota bacterium]|tara:strand:+ start:837 stop:1235 length:399 start_codon:yes stop_codon:yes gene_type:complete
MNAISLQVQRSWTKVSPLLQIQNENEYDVAIDRLNALIDEVGTDEKHPLYSLLDTLGTVIHAYEEENHPLPKIKGRDSLRFLMEEHHLTQSELPEVGSQGVVSEVLRGKRELNVRQIRALSKRFSVAPSVFI